MSAGPYDVFLSYRHREPDKTWTRKTLLPRLEAAGLRVCIDFRDFGLGAALLKEMERAVTSSRYTVAVLSPAYAESGFTDLENVMADHLSTENKDVRLIVLMREGAKPSLRMRARLMLDMSDDSEFETNMVRLCDALAKPAE